MGKDSVVTDELSRASELEGASAAEAEAVTAGVAATIYFGASYAAQSPASILV